MIEKRGVHGVLEMIDEYNDTMDFVRELGGRTVSYLKNKIDHEMNTTELEDKVRSKATAKLKNIMTKYEAHGKTPTNKNITDTNNKTKNTRHMNPHTKNTKN